MYWIVPALLMDIFSWMESMVLEMPKSPSLYPPFSL